MKALVRGLVFLMGGMAMAHGATELALWNGDMPGEGSSQPESARPDRGDNVIRLTHVSNPTLTFYPAADHGRPNPLVIVCPGGGYSILAYNLEGTEVAEWLNSIGVSAALLKYRVPNNRAGALADAQRAVRMVRARTEEWNLDPRRIGMLGFSAGGHLTAACSNLPDRPDFTVLIYPAYLHQEDGITLVDEMAIGQKTPPAFVVQTQDDHSWYRSSLAYAVALDATGIPVELHLFAKGGHGYGLRPSEHPVSRWPELCEAWMRETDILPAAAGRPAASP